MPLPRWPVLCTLPLWLAACVTTPPPTTVPAQAAAQWTAPLPQNLPHQGHMGDLAGWWQRLDDPLLVALIAAAQEASPTVASAAARTVRSLSNSSPSRWPVVVMRPGRSASNWRRTARMRRCEAASRVRSKVGSASGSISGARFSSTRTWSGR